jgi:hypothetical protein
VQHGHQLQVGLGVGLHAPLQGIHRASLESLADLRLFYSGVIDAEENSRITDAVVLGRRFQLVVGQQGAAQR